MKSTLPDVAKDFIEEIHGLNKDSHSDLFSFERPGHENDNWYKLIFENVDAVIIRLNKIGKIIESNNRVDDCFGFTRDEVVGKHFSKLGIFSIKDLTKLVKLFSDAMNGKVSTFSDELYAKNKKGQKLVIKLYSAIVRTDGKIDGIITIIHDITEQKKLEKALRESEDKYRTIFDNVNEVIVCTNKFGKITEVNSKSEEYYGFKRDELIGKHFTKLGILHTIDLRKMALLFADAIQGKITNYIGELESYDKEGNKILIDVNSTVVKKDGKIDGTVTVIHNITERHRSEEALRKSEEKFSRLFSASWNPICIVDLDKGHFIDVNDSFLRYCGYSREEIIGHSALELGLWVNKEDLQKMIKRFYKSGSVYNYEIDSRTKNGETRTGLFSGNFIEIGGKLCLATVITDITEQKWAEEFLRESEEFTSSLLTNTPNPILVMYPDTSIKYVNPAFEQLSGYSLSEILGMKAPYPWWPQDKKDEIYADMQKTVFGIDAKKEMAYQKKSGERFWVELNATIIFKNGESQYVLVNWVDITGRKQMELALRESEERFSKAFNASPSIMTISTLDGRYVAVNESFLRATGYTREEIISHNVHDLNMWKNPDDRAQIVKKLNEKGHVENEEFQFNTKSSNSETGLFSAELIHIGGEPRVISVVQDITRRKQVEETLRFSDAAFKSLHDSVIAMDNLGNITHWNNISEELFGIKASEAIGKKLVDVMIPMLEPTGGPIDLFRKIVDQGYYKDELVLNTPSGPKWADMTIQVIEKDNKRYGFVVTAQDITERKQAEKLMQESEEKFSKAFSSASDAMIIFSVNGSKFIEVNDSYTRISGYSREELIGRNADTLNMWANPEERRRMLKLMLGTGRMVNEELGLRTKSGELRTCLFSTEPFHFGGEKRFIIVVQDITKRKQMEIALLDSEEKFSKAFNASANAISIKSIKTNCFIEANESFSTFTGYSHDEIVGHNAAELDFSPNKDEFKKWIDAIEKEGRTVNFEFISRMKSGEIRIGLASAVTINISGEPCRMVVITDVTEHKKAEEALWESEEKFSKAFSTSSNAMSITSLMDNKYIEVNDSYTRFTGYPREEVIGRNSRELNLWVDEDEYQQFQSLLADQGKFHNLEFLSRMKTGEVRNGLASAETITIGGKLCRIVSVTDITEHKKAESRLRLLSSVTRQVTDAIIVTDPHFKISYMNKAARDLFGYSVEESLGMDLKALDAKPLPSETLQKLKDALNTGRPWNGVLPKRRKDGSSFCCDCHCSPMYDEKGRLSSHIIVHRDITEQIEIVAKLKAHKQLIENIINSMPEGVLVVDSSDQIILVNESFRNIFHTGRRVIENRQLRDIIRVQQLFELYTLIKMGNTADNSLEFRYKVRNVEKILTSVIIKMDGERTLLIFSDVSREREEDDKLYLMDRLASLGEMAAGLAHELNNPLTGILTLSQLLVNTDLPEQQKEDLQCVYDEAKRAASIVKNVLLFTRNKSYENGKSSPNEVVTELLRLREHEQKSNNIEVVTDLQEDLPEILLDKYQLQQVILNIILNAEAAIEEANRPGILTITTERVNSHVNIILSDNGCGIKKHVLPRIFDPFFTTKDIGKGTGLGLSICYGIIVKHGGKISVKTRVGKGTTFTIRMPVSHN
jgi:two-component system NtrC family sensor kinase